MRRIAVVIVLVFAVVIGYNLAFPQNAATPGVKTRNLAVLKLDKRVYLPTDEMRVTVVNEGNVNVTTGYGFVLYKLDDGRWVEVPLNVSFAQIVVTIAPGRSWTQTVNLSRLHLAPGRYRILKIVVVTDPVTKMSMGRVLWGEFEVRGR